MSGRAPAQDSSGGDTSEAESTALRRAALLFLRLAFSPALRSAAASSASNSASRCAVAASYTAKDVLNNLATRDARQHG